MTRALPIADNGNRPRDPCCTVPVPAALDAEEIVTVTSDLELLAHPVRLQLLAVLARSEGNVCVCDLESVVPVKQPTVSHHLGVLRKAGLVEAERIGLWAYYAVRRDALRELRARLASALARLAGEPDAVDGQSAGERQPEDAEVGA